ncbi:MAG: glycosyltransferase family 4 protein [Acidimicrobiales bacterium]
MTRARLGIVVTHPIQYQVPLYRYLAAHSSLEPLVFYLSDHGLEESFDPGFGREVKYDVALLGGYEHRMVRNWSPAPAVGKPWGVFNPALPSLIRRSRLDALLVHGYSNISAWIAYLTAGACQIPYLLRGESRPDQGDLSSARLMVKRRLIGPLVRRAGACLAIGGENREFYSSYGADPDDIFFAPYSVDTDYFKRAGDRGREQRGHMLGDLGLRPELPLVLFAAKLQPWKRPIDVVMAMDRLDQKANLVVIGDGPLRRDVEELASVRPWMRALGFINQSEIAKWYGAADLFVLPSDREPWGLGVNEAMAGGAVPIVSDTVGCATDLVTADVGWVYPTGSVPALARAIEEGCRPGALTERRSAAQRRSAEFGIAATARGIETAVAAILDS